MGFAIWDGHSNLPVLLYDGTCGLCASSVQFLLRHERRQTLRFAPLQGSFAAAIHARHPELKQVDSMVLVERAHAGAPERVWVRSAAALRLASYLGGGWRLLAIGWLLPAFLRDAAYDFIAHHRHHIFGAERCLLPPPEVGQRFLD